MIDDKTRPPVAVDRAGRRTNPKGVRTYFRDIRVAIRRSVHGRIRAWRDCEIVSQETAS